MRSRYKYFHNTSPYFVTCTVVNWIAIFTSPVMFDIIIESLRFLRETQHCPVRNLHVPAFVIPECFYRVSRGSSILDSRQKHAGMTALEQWNKTRKNLTGQC